MIADDDASGRGAPSAPFVVVAVWTLYGMVELAQWYANRSPGVRAPWRWWGPAVLCFGIAAVWAVVTPAIVTLVRAERGRRPRLDVLAAHVIAAAAIHALLHVPTAVGLYFTTTSWPALEYRRGVLPTLTVYVVVVLAVLAIDRGRLARRRAAQAARLETDLARARLDTLRRQLQPHFLFNTLNTIAALTETDPRRATEMISRLGDLLRRSLDEHERPLIPLADEIDFVRLYLDIERVRFESWLDVAEEIDDGALGALVPPMILQPLVENAIKHGIAPSGRRGTIVIRAVRTAGDRLVLEVIDDGAGPRMNGAAAREGVGLRATRERLHHQFAGCAELRLLGEPGRTRARIDLPFVRRSAVVHA